MALDRYLGPARVVRGAAGDLVVALEDATDGVVVHATLALAFPYRPTAGDRVLVIGDARAFYVIGVLAGRGRTQLAGPRRAAIRADGGRLRLVGDRGVKLTGPRIRLQTGHLRRLALTAVQTFGKLRTDARDEVKVDAGEIDELSQQGWLTQARRVVLKALSGARVKSTTVRLG